MAQFANFLSVPTEQVDRSGYSDIFSNIMQGYKNAATPSMINQQLKGMKFANKLAELQSSEQNQGLEKRYKEAQIAQMMRAPQSAKPKPTQFEQYLQAYNNAPEGSEDKRYLGALLEKETTRGNGITIGTDPVTGKQTVQIGGGGQAGLAKSSAGEEPYYEEDPETGEQKQVGFYVKPTTEEIKEYQGRAFFNNTMPFLIDSTSRYSGKNGTNQFMSDVNNFEQSPEAQKNVINYFAALKLIPSSAVKEAATLSAPNTQKVFNQLAASINSSDLPKIAEKIGKEYLLPPSVAKDAANLSLDILNKSTEAGKSAVPARIVRRFQNEAQNQQPQERMFKGPDGKTYTLSQMRQMGVIK